MAMEKALFFAWNIYLNHFRYNLLFLVFSLETTMSELKLLRLFCHWTGEPTVHTVAWLHCSCTQSLPGLLQGSVLDYGSHLVCVITKPSNPLWQLRLRLDAVLQVWIHRLQLQMYFFTAFLPHPNPLFADVKTSLLHYRRQKMTSSFYFLPYLQCKNCSRINVPKDTLKKIKYL